jgi:hypothetical protein
MLILAACIACTITLDTIPATTTLGSAPAEPGGRPAFVGDTVPFGNRFGLPFTREEYKRALRQITEEEEAEFRTRLIYEPDPETIGIGVSDTDLLLLAAVSDSVAQRVVGYRPRLRDAVLRVRENPAAFIARFRGGP